jgi:plasmid stabilization system protein ParE
MNLHKIRINPLALKDLKDIKEYISFDLENPKAAKRIVEKIIKRYEALKNFLLSVQN